MTNVPEEKLAEAASYSALQAARTALQAETPKTPGHHAAGIEVAYCMRDCLTDLGIAAANYLPARPA
jgi:hypothetical protein